MSVPLMPGASDFIRKQLGYVMLQVNRIPMRSASKHKQLGERRFEMLRAELAVPLHHCNT
jgi:hypothetical protein